jgi:hypothetical protein
MTPSIAGLATRVTKRTTGPQTPRRKWRSARFNDEPVPPSQIRRGQSDAQKNRDRVSSPARPGLNRRGPVSFRSPRTFQRPSDAAVIETQVATWLLLHSVPRETEWNLAPEIPAARLLIGLGLPDAFADDRIEIRWTDGRHRDLSRWEGRRAPGDGGLLLLSAACILTFGRAKFARADPDGPEAGPRAATPVF